MHSLLLRRTLIAQATLVLLVACGDDDAPADAANDIIVLDSDAADVLSVSCEVREAPARACTAASTDYTPAAADMWDACISDSGEYVRVEATISSIQRVASFERIMDVLRETTADRYLRARMIYQEEQGLDSRVVRRFDPRVAVPDGTDCTLVGVPEEFPEYCVGPAVLQPILLQSFAEGDASGGDVPAARIEAALLRFLYVSVFKEATTCATTAKDCDSAYAYYTGGEPARGGIGLAADVLAADPEANDRVWDGLLGLRCWRDLDSADVATNLVLRDQAIAQIDRALTDGVAAIVRARLAAFCDGGGAADWAFVSTLGPALTLSAQTRAEPAAAVLEAQFARGASDVDVDALVGALDSLFPCP